MELERFVINEGLLDDNSSVDLKFQIILEEDIDDKYLKAEKFAAKDRFINDIFSTEYKLPKSKSGFQKVESEVISGSDLMVISNWKNVENNSARLLDYYDDTVVLECLIDKERGIYEERSFSSTLFEGYDLKRDSLFLLRIFERPNEIRMEIHNDPELTLKDDFPKFDYVAAFKDSRLFKKE